MGRGSLYDPEFILSFSSLENWIEICKPMGFKDNSKHIFGPIQVKMVYYGKQKQLSSFLAVFLSSFLLAILELCNETFSPIGYVWFFILYNHYLQNFEI